MISLMLLEIPNDFNKSLLKAFYEPELDVNLSN